MKGMGNKDKSMGPARGMKVQDRPAMGDMESTITGQMAVGQRLLAKDTSGRPRYARSGAAGTPETRDRLLSAFLGFRSGFEEAGKYIQQGNPIAAAIAGIAGGLTGPTPEAIAGQREAQLRSQQMAELGMTPLGHISPVLAKEWPEYAELPLDIFQIVAPALQKNKALEARMDNWEKTFGLRKDEAGRSKERIDALAEEREQRESERKIGRRRQQLLDIEQRDPILKKLREQEIGIGQVDALIMLVAEGNSVAASALGVKMAKAMGEVGVLTESDIKRYITSGELAQGTADKLKLMMAGQLTVPTLGEISQISGILKKSFASKIQPRYDRYINSYASVEKISPEQMASELGLTLGRGISRDAPKKYVATATNKATGEKIGLTPSGKWEKR